MFIYLIYTICKVGNSFVQNLKDIRAWQAALDTGELPVWRGLSLSGEDRLRRAPERPVDRLRARAHVGALAQEEDEQTPLGRRRADGRRETHAKGGALGSREGKSERSPEQGDQHGCRQ